LPHLRSNTLLSILLDFLLGVLLRRRDHECRGSENTPMAKLKVHEDKPYFSTLTRRYYSDYDAAFQDSLREGGGADVDFNLYCVHPDGSAEFVF
jgi:hypothetical protein